MVDFSDKIVKFFTQLNNYPILKIEKDYVIIAFWMNLNESKGLSQNPMHPNEVIRIRELQVVFAVTAEKLSKESKEFLKSCDLVILKTCKDDLKSFDSFKQLFNRFVKEVFHS